MRNFWVCDKRGQTVEAKSIRVEVREISWKVREKKVRKKTWEIKKEKDQASVFAN